VAPRSRAKDPSCIAWMFLISTIASACLPDVALRTTRWRSLSPRPPSTRTDHLLAPTGPSHSVASARRPRAVCSPRTRPATASGRCSYPPAVAEWNARSEPQLRRNRGAEPELKRRNPENIPSQIGLRLRRSMSGCAGWNAQRPWPS
jgi:hypothetical protein